MATNKGTAYLVVFFGYIHITWAHTSSSRNLQPLPAKQLHLQLQFLEF